MAEMDDGLKDEEADEHMVMDVDLEIQEGVCPGCDQEFGNPDEDLWCEFQR